MLHFKNKGYGPEHSHEIIYKARDLTSDMNVSVRVARIATKFVEIDVGVEKESKDAEVKADESTKKESKDAEVKADESTKKESKEGEKSE